MKKCCACKETKELNLFYKNSQITDGYFARCKKCMTNGILCKQGRPTGMKYNVEGRKPAKYDNSSWTEIRLVSPTKKDYMETYEFLKRIGYKLDESIHEQFCNKHDLEPTEPKEFKNYFSVKDCGLS